MKSRTTKKTKVTDLPPDILPTDLQYPQTGEGFSYTQRQELGLESTALTFYHSAGCGWVLCTLHISNPSRRQAAGTAARTYSIGVTDRKVYTVGRGPHVTKEVTVYITPSNLERLRKYVELWKQGMADASQIRDRISSRRAQGQLHRGAGRTSWSW